MSSRAKGRRSLNKVKEYYESQGYLVDEVELGGKFRKSRDLFSSEEFGGFDLIAIDSKQTLLIQVKTNTPATQSQYKSFARKYATRNRYIVCVTVYDYRGLRIQRYCKNGSILETDLRK